MYLVSSLCFERRLYVGCHRIRMIVCILLSLMYNSSHLKQGCIGHLSKAQDKS